MSQPRHVKLRARACLRRIALLALLVPAPGYTANFEEFALGQVAAESATGRVFQRQPEAAIVLSAAATGTSSSRTRSTAATATNRPPATPMEELIVTAQKRSERLRDVPISVSVLDANSIALSGLHQVQEVAEYVPNLHLSRSVDLGTRITLRGVGANSRNIGFDTRVGMYLDGVYLGPSPALNYELLDLARIEILRGPQGTLYGKNTVAGAINLVSSPIPEALDVRVSADIGNLEYRQVAGSISIPVNDALTTRIAISQRRRDGYVDNLFTGAELNEQDVWSYRAQLQYRVNEQLTAGLVLDGLDSERLSLLGEAVSDTFALTPEPFAPQAREVQFNVDPTEERDTGGANLTLDYQFDGFSLKSISGYRDTASLYRNDTDYSPIDLVSLTYDDDYRQVTQEFQLLSPVAARLEYLVGYYYYDQQATTNRDIHIGPAALALGLTPGAAVFNRGRVRTESHALFANASYALSDRLELGLGARYTNETKDADWLIDGRNSGIFAIATDQVRDSRSDSYLSTSASLRYFPNQRHNLYLRYASGFKSGGYNLDFVTAADVSSGLEFDKETVDSLEAGVKSQLWNGKLQLNLAAFVAEYDDYQVNQFVDLGGGGTSLSIRNAAQVTTRGLEAEIGYRPTARLEVNAALGLLDTRFDRFPGGGARGADVSGNELVNAPDLSFSMTASYRHPLRTLAATLLIRGELSHSASYFTTADNVKSQQLLLGDTVPFGSIPDQTLVNARVGLIASRSGWEVYLWGRNLTDQRQATESERDFFGTVTAMPSVPRTFGLELLWRYQP